MKLKCVGVCCGRREWHLFIVERERGHPYRWKQPPTVIQACNRPPCVGNILLHRPLAKTRRKQPWKALNRSKAGARCAVVNCWEENRTSGSQNRPNRQPNLAWASTAFSRATHRLPRVPAVGRVGHVARLPALPACTLALLACARTTRRAGGGRPVCACGANVDRVADVSGDVSTPF